MWSGNPKRWRLRRDSLFGHPAYAWRTEAQIKCVMPVIAKMAYDSREGLPCQLVPPVTFAPCYSPAAAPRSPGRPSLVIEKITLHLPIHRLAKSMQLERSNRHGNDAGPQVTGFDLHQHEESDFDSILIESISMSSRHKCDDAAAKECARQGSSTPHVVY